MLQATCTKKYLVSQDILWEIITNSSDSTWRSDLSKIEVTDDTHFVEYTKNGFPTFFEIIHQKQPSYYECRLENDNMIGNFLVEIKGKPKECEFKMTETIEVKKWFMKPLAKRYLVSQQSKYLKDLEIQIKKQTQK